MRPNIQRLLWIIRVDFDDFLREDDIYEGVTARAIKRVLARQLDELMRREEIS